MKRFRDWSFSTRINAVLLLFLLTAGGGIGGFVYLRTYAILSKEVGLTATAAVNLTAERINSAFPPIETAARVLALALQVHQTRLEGEKRMY